MGHHHHKHNHGHHFHGDSSTPAYYPSVQYPGTAPPLAAYPASEPWGYAPPVPYSYGSPAAGLQQQGQLNHSIADVHRHGRNERMGEMGAAAAGAFAMYERHEAKVDPAHARRHKLEAEVAGAAALGSAGYAYHEHIEKKKSEHIVGGLNEGNYYSHEYHQTHHHGAHGKKHHHHHLLKW